MLSLVFMAFLCGGCEDLYDEFGDFTPSAFMRYLRPSETSFEYESSSAHKVHFMVESMDTEWEFSNSSNWFTLSPNKGHNTTEISMSIQENPSGESSRIGLFQLLSRESDWMYNKTLKVSQIASKPYLTVNNDNLYFEGSSGQQTILINSNCNWTFETSEYWIKGSKNDENSKLVVSVSANSDENYRTGEITIKYNQYSYKTIKIYQYPSTIEISDASLTFDNIATQVTMSIASEAPWKSSVSDNWISVTPSSGNAGKSEVVIFVTPNMSVSERKGYVAFYTSDSPKAQIEIIQAGVYIKTDIDELSFNAYEDSQIFNILSNTNWKCQSYPEWIALSEYSGTGDAQLKITVSENDNVNSRTGKIIFTQEGVSISHVVTVEQKGKDFDILETYMEFPHYASSQSFNLKSEIDWNSFTDAQWITSDPQFGKTDAKVSVPVTENNSYAERIGDIIYRAKGKELSVQVIQSAKYFTIEDDIFDFSSRGGNVNISFGTNETWNITIEEEKEWLSLSETSGNGNGNITLSVNDNPSVNSRSAIIVIHTGTGQSYRIPIKQAARYLKVDTQSLFFRMEGGTSNNIYIDTDGDYEIVSSVDWISINKISTSAFSITTGFYENNNEEKREGLITVRLTDLLNGSLEINLPVVQEGKRIIFKFQEYGKELNWNIKNYPNFQLEINKYTSDVDWNSNSNKFEILINGYKTDDIWNKTINQLDTLHNGKVIYKYKPDNCWNNDSVCNSTIIRDKYNKDNDWSLKIPPIDYFNIEFDKTECDANVKNWNTEEKGESDMKKDSYNTDDDWNQLSPSLEGFDTKIEKQEYDANVKNWNTEEKGESDMKKDSYNTDDDWNQLSPSLEGFDTKIEKQECDDNVKNWNTEGQNKIEFDKTECDDAIKDWNLKEQKEIIIEKNQFKNDVNWN